MGNKNFLLFSYLGPGILENFERNKINTYSLI